MRTGRKCPSSPVEWRAITTRNSPFMALTGLQIFGDLGGSRCALGYGRYGMHIIASILLAAGSACIRMTEVERIAV